MAPAEMPENTNGSAPQPDTFEARVAAAVDERVNAVLLTKLPQLFEAMSEKSAQYVERTMGPKLVADVTEALERKGRAFREQVQRQAAGAGDGDEAPPDDDGPGGGGEGEPPSGRQPPPPGASKPQPSPHRQPGNGGVLSGLLNDPVGTLKVVLELIKEVKGQQDPFLELLKVAKSDPTTLRMAAPFLVPMIHQVAPEPFSLYTPSPWDNQFTGLLADAYKQGARTKQDLRRWLDTPEGGAVRPEHTTRTEPQLRYSVRPQPPSGDAQPQPSDAPRPQNPVLRPRNAATAGDSGTQAAQRRSKRPLEGLV